MCAFVSSYGSSLGMPIKDSFDTYRAAVMDASDHIQDLNSPLTISLVSDIDDHKKNFPKLEKASKTTVTLPMTSNYRP